MLYNAVMRIFAKTIRVERGMTGHGASEGKLMGYYSPCRNMLQYTLKKKPCQEPDEQLT